MATFSATETARPPGSIVVPPSAWAPTWDERPTEDVCIGLRLLADVDTENAYLEAYRRARGLFPDHQKSSETTTLFIVSFHGAFIRWVIGLGTCDPNNVRAPWHLFAAAPEDIPRDALTDIGAQMIFDAWERMRLTSDITLPEATDEEIGRLAELATERLPILGATSSFRAQRARRLLRFVLDEMASATPPSSQG